MTGGAPHGGASSGRRGVAGVGWAWLGAVRRVVAGLRWYLREVTGEAAYDHYLERHRRMHPQQPACSRREFERRRSELAEHHPQARCC